MRSAALALLLLALPASALAQGTRICSLTDGSPAVVTDEIAVCRTAGVATRKISVQDILDLVPAEVNDLEGAPPASIQDTEIFIGTGAGTGAFAAVSGDGTLSNGGVFTIGSDKVLEAMLKAVNAPTDEFCLTYELTTGDFEWQSCGGIGGSTGATDNAILRADGTGGSTLQNSGPTITDTGVILAVPQALSTPAISSSAGSTTGINLGRTGAVNDIEFVTSGVRRWFIDSAGTLAPNNTARGAQILATGCNGGATPCYTMSFDQNTGFGFGVADNSDEARIFAGGAVGLTVTATTTTLASILNITPQATAPATCSIGQFYSDTSGGACACVSTNTWENMVTTGDCT